MNDSEETPGRGAEVVATSEKILHILLKYRDIKSDFLNEVREESKLSGAPLEKLLLDKNLVTGTELALAFSEYLKMPPIVLTHFTPDPDVLELVPRELMIKHFMVPIAKVGRMLTVALGDPFDVEGIEEARAATNLEIVPLVTTQKDVDETLERTAPHVETDLTVAFQEDDIVEVGHDEQVDASLEDMMEKATGAPVIRVVNSMLIEAMRKGASDIHFEPQEKTIQLRYRIDGLLYATRNPPKSMQGAIISRLKIMSNLNIAEHRIPQDGRFKMKAMGRECDVRVSVLPTVHGEKIVMRLLDKASLTPSLSALGLDPKAYENLKYAIDQPHGLILVTGPTGSGKTTTLYSALQELNTSEVNIVTVEDPVEYQLWGINQVQTHSEIGLTFAQGLRSLLRQSPDIIMVGEIRDSETAGIAVQSALTGHLVLSTLHTNDAAGAVARMLYMGVDGFLLASSLIMAQAQRLFRKLCPACKVEREIPMEVLRFNHIDPAVFAGGTLFKPQGCPKCMNLGFKGRGAMMEILLVNPVMRELILKQPDANIVRKQAVADGMLTLRDVGLLRAKDGLTSIEEILMVTKAE